MGNQTDCSHVIKRLVAGLVGLTVVLLGSVACSGSDGSLPGAVSLPEIDVAQLDQLIPESALPEGFREFRRGPALFNGSENHTPPSLVVVFKDSQGSLITFLVVIGGEPATARHYFELYAWTYEQLPYDLEVLPPCDKKAGPPPAQDACAYVEKPSLDIGDEAKAFVSVHPLQGKDATVDIFIRGAVAASLWLEAVPGSGLLKQRERLAAEFDNRIRAYTE